MPKNQVIQQNDVVGSALEYNVKCLFGPNVSHV